jgi:hypothetical protein
MFEYLGAIHLEMIAELKGTRGIIADESVKSPRRSDSGSRRQSLPLRNNRSKAKNTSRCGSRSTAALRAAKSDMPFSF